MARARSAIPITPAASMTVSNVDLTGATKAYLNFNVFPTLDIAYSLNGNAWHTVKDPMGNPGNWRIRSLSIPVSLSELHPGVNSISIKTAGTRDHGPRQRSPTSISRFSTNASGRAFQNERSSYASNAAVCSVR